MLTSPISQFRFKIEDIRNLKEVKNILNLPTTAKIKRRHTEELDQGVFIVCVENVTRAGSGGKWGRGPRDEGGLRTKISKAAEIVSFQKKVHVVRFERLSRSISKAALRWKVLVEP